MLGAAAGDRAIERARREPIDGGGGREPRRRRHTDHLLILGLRGDVVRLGQRQLRSAGGQARLRLRDVGARDLTGGEPVAGLPQRHFKDVHVAALKLEDGGGLQKIYICGGRVEQRALLGRAQHFASGEDLAFCLTGTVCGLETVEKRLGGGQAEGRHCSGALGLRIERGPAGGGPRLRQVVQILFGQARRAGDPWAIARERSGDVFVGRTGSGALGIELGIVSIGQNERPLDRAGASAGADAPIGCRLGRRHDRKGHHCGRGKRCNLRTPRNRPSPPSTPQHAQTPGASPLAVANWPRE